MAELIWWDPFSLTISLSLQPFTLQGPMLSRVTMLRWVPSMDSHTCCRNPATLFAQHETQACLSAHSFLSIQCSTCFGGAHLMRFPQRPLLYQHPLTQCLWCINHSYFLGLDSLLIAGRVPHGSPITCSSSKHLAMHAAQDTVTPPFVYGPDWCGYIPGVPAPRHWGTRKSASWFRSLHLYSVLHISWFDCNPEWAQQRWSGSVSSPILFNMQFGFLTFFGDFC